MFRDTDKELERLQAALIEEEAEETEAPEEAQEADEGYGNVPVYKNFSNGYGKELRNYASDYRPYDIEAEEDEPEEAPRKSKKSHVGGLVFLAILLTLAIAGLAMWWVIRILKVL